MKTSLIPLAVLSCVLSIPTPQAAGQNSLGTGNSVVQPQTDQPLFKPDPNLGGWATLEQQCQLLAKGLPASSACGYFVDLLIGKDRYGATVDISNAYGQLTNPKTEDIVALTQAYVTKNDSLVSIQSLENGLENALPNAAGVNQRKQASNAPPTTGGTGLVVKPLAVSALGIAVQSGALTESQSGNNITVAGNLYNLFRLSENKFSLPNGYLQPGKQIFDDTIGDIAVSATFAADNSSAVSVPVSSTANSGSLGSTTSALFNDGPTKLTSFTANYEHNSILTVRGLENYLKKNKKQFLVIPNDSSTYTPLMDARDTLRKDFKDAKGCDQAKITQLASTFKPVTNPKDAAENPFSTFVSTYDDCFDAVLFQVESAKNTDGTIKARGDLTAYALALSNDITSVQEAIKKLGLGTDISVQYVFNHPQSQPETHDFRFIATGDFGQDGQITWTANAAGSIYATIPAGAKYGRWKDAQASGEIDWGNLGANVKGKPVFSLAGYAQYQDNPSVLNLTSSSVPSGITLPSGAQAFISGTKGLLAVVQAKASLNIGSAQIPLSFKWSNKTNLLDKTKFGAQLSLSYDLSSFLTGKGASAGQ